MNLNIYFFEGKPTIGYCFECDEQAVYNNRNDLFAKGGK